MEHFHSMWEAVKQHGGCLWSHPSLIGDRAQEISGKGNVPTDVQTREAKTMVENEMRAMFMLARGKKWQHESLRTAQQNSYMVGCNEYPTNTTLVGNVSVVLCRQAPIFGDMLCHHHRCCDMWRACLLMCWQHDHTTKH
jgi:hypothetical protein